MKSKHPPKPKAKAIQPTTPSFDRLPRTLIRTAILTVMLTAASLTHAAETDELGDLASVSWDRVTRS